MEEQTYKIKNVKSFEPVHIFDCGQCFRWDKELDGSYTGVFKGNVMNVKKDGNNVTFKGICNGDIEEICKDYFDLNTDYEDIKEKLSKIDDNVKTSVGYGSGIRILNQDLWETIISFIISANNNIPRIKGIIDRISKKYGKEVNWNGTKYYTFPTVEELSKASVEDLRALGLGFRDVRVYETTKKILNKEVDLNKLTEEKDTEKVREKLSREENNIKSLITDISHQLKTPIASLKMSCELAGSADLTWEEREEFYKKEWDEIQRLENLLDSLIHVSRLESGMIQIQPEMGSLKNTLVQAVNSVYMKAYEKSIDISLDEFQDVQIVHDSKWTGEVFVNILDNAVKYSPEHTEIRIRVTELATCMMLEFIDQGTGIPAEEAHRVFQRFYRGNQEYVKKQEGSGVGLYLARKILEEQKGTICVKVAPEGGNNFVVTLPKK